MRIHRLYALLLVLSLAGFPLVAGLSAATGIASTPVSIVMRIGTLSISLLIVFFATLHKHTAFLRGWHWAMLFLFWGAYVIRLFYDTTVRGHWLSRPPDDYWVWAIGACLVPALALLTNARHEAFKSAYQWSVVALFFAGSLVVFLGGTEVLSESGGSYDAGRLRLEALNPISAGHLGLSLVLLAAWPIISQVQKTSRAKWSMGLTAATLGMYLMVASASRGPIVTMFAIICFYLLSVNFKRVWKPMALAAVLILLGYVLAVRFEESGQFQMLSRIEDAFRGEDMAVNSRQIALVGALQQFLSSPILGSALEEEITGFYPHNVVLESFMATGLVGGLPFVALLAFGFFAAYRLLKWRSENAWAALIFVQYAIAAQFSGALYASTIMWAFLSVNIVLYYKSILVSHKRNFVPINGVGR